MSNNDKIAKLKEYIKNLVIQELEKDDELEEVSTTATAGIDGQEQVITSHQWHLVVVEKKIKRKEKK